MTKKRIVKKTSKKKVVKEVVKESIPYISPDDRPEPTEKEVIGINEAEALQKQGWRLLSVTPVGKSAGNLTVKKYKFIKE